MSYNKPEGGISQGWVIQQLNGNLQGSRFYPSSCSAILSMTTIIPIGLEIATQLQASRLHILTPVAENAAACILYIFVKKRKLS